MSRRYRYEDGPLKGANEELNDLWRRIDAIETPKTVQVVGTVGTTETELRHGLGRTPAHVTPVAQGNATVWESRNATETSIFLVASAPVNVKVKVE